MKKKPKISHLRERLDYAPDTGRITWKRLEARHFGSGFTSPAMQAVDHNRLRAGHDAEILDKKGGAKAGFVISIGGLILEPAHVAWALHHGVWPETIVDHINHDRQDNRIDNLRLATIAENNRNRRSAEIATSDYLGVCKVDGKWRASIKHAGVATHLGTFDDERKAALAYDCAAITMHREFANPNIIENPFLTEKQKSGTVG